MKRRLNASVKYREDYRPYAPLLPQSAMARYFTGGDTDPVRFMEKAYRFREGLHQVLPAVVHNDGTGRLQTVTQEEEGLLYRLLGLFGEATGHPVLVNTSFNLNGEPIVCTPDDAIRTFVTSGIDALVIGDHLLAKRSL